MNHFTRLLAGSALSLFAMSGCLSVTASSIPLTLVEMDISGSPTIAPGGPDIYVDDIYRGKPIGSRFRMYLEVGEHLVRVQGYGGPDGLLWEDEVDVVTTQGTQLVVIEYERAPAAQVVDAAAGSSDKR